MKKTLIILVLVLIALQGSGQKRLLENPGILSDIEDCISATYNCNFPVAHNIILDVEKNIPDHPVVDFLKSFILYWEYYPITPGHKKEDEFVDHMENCIRKSEAWVKREPEELEAIFFDLFSRAFYVMFWADNGKPGKVFPHLNVLYQRTMQGFDLKEEFSEFYFTTGLYNYYIKAYPEKHPAYKPIVIFFREGNQEKGLEQLEYCSNNAIFLKVEAKFFLSLIYLNYEKDLEIASSYAADLYREFPQNSFYTGKYLEILLFNRKYFFAPVLLKNLENREDPFSRMQFHLYHAYYLEKYEKRLEEARNEYNSALEISEQFGDFTEIYNAIAFMGLGRYYENKGDHSRANHYFRQAKNASSYDYILEDR